MTAYPQTLTEDAMRGDGTVYKRGGWYWIQFYEEGTRYQEPADTRDEQEARKVLRRRQKEAHGEDAKTPRSLTVGRVLEDLLEDQKTRGAKAVRSLGYHVAPVQARFGMLRVRDLDAARIDAYIRDRISAGKKNATVNRETGALGQALRLAQRRRLLRSIPHIPHLREPRGVAEFFEPEEFARVVAQLPAGIDDVARFAYRSGWRLGEILPLRWESIDMKAKEARLHDSKTGESRLLPLEAELWEVIRRRYAARAQGSPWVFQREGRRWVDIAKPWKAACEAAGVPGRRFHSLRRTVVRDMIRAGIDQKTVMDTTGHRTVSVFLRYRIVPTKEIRAALRKTARHVARARGEK